MVLDEGGFWLMSLCTEYYGGASSILCVLICVGVEVSGAEAALRRSFFQVCHNIKWCTIMRVHVFGRYTHCSCE